ncbi:MAG: hydroxyacid dehydrogenase [Bacteroidetes bacterium]|nr:hydroxyacid dehydrogenase [Bacteroidota bacterium]
MKRMNLLVSFKTDARQKQLIEDGLKDRCTISYLEDAKDRKAVIENAEIILAWNPRLEFAASEYPLLKRAKLMQLISAGGDHLPAELFNMNFDIAGNVGAYAIPMAEHVMAMVLALAKDLRVGHNKLKAGNFDQYTATKSLKGAVCAILGFGGIGKATAKLMRAFDCRIFAINTSGKTDEEVEFIGTTKDLQYVLNQADIIVISMALTKVTKNLISQQELFWMKDDAILVNVARGEIIDEKAFYDFLKTHPKFKAGIDAWWVEPFRHGKFEMNYPFLDLPNVIGTPHNSGIVPDAFQNATKEAVQNVKSYLDGKAVKGIFKKEDYL